MEISQQVSLLALVALVAASGPLVRGMPSAYVLVPIEDMQQYFPQHYLRAIPVGPISYQKRVARSAFPQEANGGIPPFEIPAQIKSSEDAIASESSFGHHSHGPDYVDYGAYTGGYGAFGWYTDHPVTDGGYH